MKKSKHILMDTFVVKAKSLGYSVKRYSADRRIYKISKNGKSILTIGKHFPINSAVSNLIAKRKFLTKQILRDEGINTPRGVLVSVFNEVSILVKKGKLSFPLVVKPDTSSLGKMVTAKIVNIKDLKAAFLSVKHKFGEVLVEEYCEGDDYRFLVLDDKVLMVTKRGLPYVTGDGKSTVSKLINIFNKTNTWPLKIDDEVKRCLAVSGYGLQDKPEAGVKIILRRNANNSSGGTTENITKGIDNEFNNIAVKASKIVGLKLDGVDIIAPDITDFKKGYFITELNGSPGYDLSLSSKLENPYDATEDILKELFRTK